MEAALKVLEYWNGAETEPGFEIDVSAEIGALRAALSAPNVEPVAWCWEVDGVRGPVYHGNGPDADIIERAAKAEVPRTVRYLWDGPQPRREWQRLTDEEIDSITVQQWRDPHYALHRAYARAVEDALKEKNHG